MRCNAICALVLLLLQANIVESYKILGIFPDYFKSHFIAGSALMKGLAAAGHEVTVISAFPQSEPILNYRDIHVKGIIELANGNYTQTRGSVSAYYILLTFRYIAK